MNWKTAPATEKQLNYLKDFGFVPAYPLTKGEASDLISKFEEDPERIRVREDKQTEAWRRQWEEDQTRMAYVWHRNCDELKLELQKASRDEIAEFRLELREVRAARLEFWKDTFRDPLQVADFNEQAAAFYDKHGYRFKMPSNKQLQAILDALDEDSPTWDRDMPEYFFATLEHNYPDLVRRIRL